MNKITPSDVSATASIQALREQAEGMLSKKVALSTQSLDALSPAAVRELTYELQTHLKASCDTCFGSVRELVHELQVHQIELEMQNETLRRTQLQLVEMQARYFDLYDLAPVSYCTVNEAGIILEANLATAELLNQTRKSLVGQRISRYIHKDFQDVYYLSRKRLLATGLLQHCELHMVRADAGDQSYSYEGEGTTLWVNATIASAKDSSENLVQRIVLTDITNDKIMALAMQKSEAKLRAIVDSHA